MGTGALKNLLPRLFQVASVKNVTVAKAGRWHENRWEWLLSWRRNLFAWEESLLLELQNILLLLIFKGKGRIIGSFCWIPHGTLALSPQ